VYAALAALVGPAEQAGSSICPFLVVASAFTAHREVFRKIVRSFFFLGGNFSGGGGRGWGGGQSSLRGCKLELDQWLPSPPLTQIERNQFFQGGRAGETWGQNSRLCLVIQRGAGQGMGRKSYVVERGPIWRAPAFQFGTAVAIRPRRRAHQRAESVRGARKTSPGPGGLRAEPLLAHQRPTSAATTLHRNQSRPFRYCLKRAST